MVPDRIAAHRDGNRDEHSHDGDDHHQLDEREAA
jgi:hypothetical protein